MASGAPDKGAVSSVAKLLFLSVRRFQGCWVTVEGESHCRMEQKIGDIACQGTVSLAKQKRAGVLIRRVGRACDELRSVSLYAWLKRIVYLLQTQCSTDARTLITGTITVGALCT